MIVRVARDLFYSLLAWTLVESNSTSSLVELREEHDSHKS